MRQQAPAVPDMKTASYCCCEAPPMRQLLRLNTSLCAISNVFLLPLPRQIYYLWFRKQVLLVLSQISMDVRCAICQNKSEQLRVSAGNWILSIGLPWRPSQPAAYAPFSTETKIDKHIRISSANKSSAMAAYSRKRNILLISARICQQFRTYGNA